jgi:hypothetical protein
MSVSNHTSRPGVFEDLRGFLFDHAGQHVSVGIDADRSMFGVSVLHARGRLKPLTLKDHERDAQWFDEYMTESGHEGYENRDHTEELADLVEHHADFELVDSHGRKTASMDVWDHDVRDVIIGRLGEITEHYGREIVVTRHYATFRIEVMRWDHDHPDDDGSPGDLPSQLIKVRIEQWIERPIEQALEEVAG